MTGSENTTDFSAVRIASAHWNRRHLSRTSGRSCRTRRVRCRCWQLRLQAMAEEQALADASAGSRLAIRTWTVVNVAYNFPGEPDLPTTDRLQVTQSRSGVVGDLDALFDALSARGQAIPVATIMTSAPATMRWNLPAFAEGGCNDPASGGRRTALARSGVDSACDAEAVGRSPSEAQTAARATPVRNRPATGSSGAIATLCPVVLHVSARVCLPRPETESHLAWATTQSTGAAADCRRMQDLARWRCGPTPGQLLD